MAYWLKIFLLTSKKVSHLMIQFPKDLKDWKSNFRVKNAAPRQ